MLYQTKPPILTPGQGVDFLYQAEQDVKRLEEALAEAKAYKRQLETVELPEIFANSDQNEAESTGGAKAKLGMHIEGGLPKIDEKASQEEQAAQAEARAKAIELCASYGWGPLIKSKVSAAWDKGDRDKALALFEQLRKDNSVILSIDEAIHPQTLAAQVKIRLKEGKSVDEAALGLTVLTAVKLTKRPKN